MIRLACSKCANTVKVSGRAVEGSSDAELAALIGWTTGDTGWLCHQCKPKGEVHQVEATIQGLGGAS